MTTLLARATLVTAATSLVAITAAVVQLTQMRKQRRRDFEDLFVQRYWAIMERLSLAALEGNPSEDGVVAAADRLAIMAYLRRCEDELELRAERWVSADTWEPWRQGIASQLRRWPFEPVWKDVSASEAARGANGQFAQLRRAGEDIYRNGFDPAPKLSTLRRLGRGR